MFRKRWLGFALLLAWSAAPAGCQDGGLNAVADGGSGGGGSGGGGGIGGSVSDGCDGGGGGSVGGGAENGGTAGGRTDAADNSRFATDPGASVLTDAVNTIVVESRGDGLDYPFPPACAVCKRYRWRYTLLRGTGELSWERCAVAGTGSHASDFTPESGSRTLTESERTTALEAVRAVRVSARTDCGADKSTTLLEVRAGDASLTYGDDFYACQKDYAHYVEYEPMLTLGALLKTLAP